LKEQALALAAALRQQQVVLDRERQASVGKNEKMEILYQYLAGTEFLNGQFSINPVVVNRNTA